MKDYENVDFSVQGWLDRNDTQFADRTHSGWFKLFGRPNRDVLVEAEFSSSESPFDEKSTCIVYPKDERENGLIYMSIILPPERYDQIYRTLCRYESRLELIDVSVSFRRKSTAGAEYSIEGLSFVTCSGDYFLKLR